MRTPTAIALALTNVALATLLAILALRTSPSQLTQLALLAAGATLAAALAVTHAIQAIRSTRLARAPTDTDHAELAEREQALIDRTHRLEVREQRLSRRLAVHQFVDEDHFVDVVDGEMSGEAIERLVRADAELLALIEQRSRHAFDDILANRYAAPEGVDMSLVMRDVGELIEAVARLYQPDARDPLLETEIELIAKATSSAALHLLVVVDDLPLDLKSYNAASLYRLLQRAAQYYGTYRDVKPFLDMGLNALQVARFALGANPVTLGATWVAGKLAAQGAQKVTGQLLHRRSLQLLHDTIRVIAFEVALVYGEGFRRRDANWFLGAELVNLELLRGEDRRGRDEAIGLLSKLTLRHEFDRLLLFRHLGDANPVDVATPSIDALLTNAERQRVVEVLLAHCHSTGVNLSDTHMAQWRTALEARLQVAAQAPNEVASKHRSGLRPPSPEWIVERLRHLRRRTK